MDAGKISERINVIEALYFSEFIVRVHSENVN